MWKYLSSTLLLAGCLSPGGGEMDSNDRAEFAANEIGQVMAIADSSARTNVGVYRVSISGRSIWISRRNDAGAFAAVDGTQRQVESTITIERIEGMERQADGSHTLDFTPAGGRARPVSVTVADGAGSRRTVLATPDDPKWRIADE